MGFIKFIFLSGLLALLFSQFGSANIWHQFLWRLKKTFSQHGGENQGAHLDCSPIPSEALSEPRDVSKSSLSGLAVTTAHSQTPFVFASNDEILFFKEVFTLRLAGFVEAVGLTKTVSCISSSSYFEPTLLKDLFVINMYEPYCLVSSVHDA